MGQSVTIFCAQRWTVASFAPFFARIARSVGVGFTPHDRQLVLQEDPKYMSMMRLEEHEGDRAFAIEDCETNELLDPDFRQHVAGLRFFDVSFHDIDVTRELLRSFAVEAVAHGERAWFDTDYGWVIDAWHFLRELGGVPSFGSTSAKRRLFRAFCVVRRRRSRSTAPPLALKAREKSTFRLGPEN